MKEKIAVLGLGYVGLPIALAFARKFPATVAFDIDAERVRELSTGLDSNGEVAERDLKSSPPLFSSNANDLKSSDIFIVCVPTPIDNAKRPDLQPLGSATRIVAQHLKAGSIVVYESTVYPGLTEEFCVPMLEKISGMVFGKDFFVGYSPERINPGDTEHVLEKITKVVSGSDAKTTERIAKIYKAIIEAGIHIAPSIKVAEMAKVLENTQRDLNIALMNELAVICDKIGIRTADVLSAAKTKWNFLPFTPGLVGGHCIGVDPYYLTAKAESLGYHPQVILAGRRINDGVGPFIAQRLVRLLSNRPHALSEARVAILGLSFKENISDIRNSRVPDIYQELRQFGIESFVCDPLASPERVEHEYGIRLTPLESLKSLDAIVLAVPHTDFLEKLPTILGLLNKGGVLMDVKSAVPSALVTPEISYWSL